MSEERGFECKAVLGTGEGMGASSPAPETTWYRTHLFTPGSDKEIDVIDVTRQADCKMKLGDFVKYYYSGKREKVLNVISLEFSDTR